MTNHISERVRYWRLRRGLDRNMLAAIADTHSLGLLAELTPSGVPIAVLPFVNASLAANRVFGRSVAALREEGVTVLLGEGAFVPHAAGTGGGRLELFPWDLALDAVER